MDFYSIWATSVFMVGENVMLIVQRYEDEKLQMYGKIMSKW